MSFRPRATAECQPYLQHTPSLRERFEIVKIEALLFRSPDPSLDNPIALRFVQESRGRYRTSRPAFIFVLDGVGMGM